MADFTSEIHSLTPGSIIEFFQFQIDETTTYRCYGSGTTGAVINWKGVNWQPVPFKSEGFEWDGTGKNPEPTITIADKDNLLLSYLFQLDDIRGHPVIRYKTLYEYLNTNTSAPAELWLVDTVEADGFTFKARLAMPFAQQNTKLPGRVMMSKDFPALSRIRV